MANLDFNEAGARAWMARAENLNERTNQAIQAVSACLETLKANSVGDMIDELGVTGAQLLEHGAQMAQSLSGLIDTVQKIIASLASAVLEAVAQVVGGRGRSTNL